MKFVGMWHIAEMELWDDDYLHMEEQAHIEINKRCTGHFKFGLVYGAIDGEVVKEGDIERFEFTWEGKDECDSAFGAGWLQLQDNKTLKGRIAFHQGERSLLTAKRVLENDDL